jgi:heme/copper-type cytochrome/quinol oxidase subunit 2
MTSASRENGSKEQMLIYIIVGVASVIIFIMVLLVIVCHRRYKRARVGKYRSVKRVIVMRPVSKIYLRYIANNLIDIYIFIAIT